MIRSLKIMTVAALLGAIAIAPASAADLAYKAPRVDYIQPNYDWSGLYVTGKVGYSWSTARDNEWPVASEFAKTHMGGIEAGGGIGYRKQLGSIVIGLETDFVKSWEQGGGNVSYCAYSYHGYCKVSETDTHKTRLDYVGTVMPTIGYAMNRWLVELGGGAAYGKLCDTNNQYTFSQYYGNGSSWNSTCAMGLGWAVKLGTHYAVTPNLSIGAELKHLEMSALSANYNGMSKVDIGVKDTAVVAVIGYKFNSPLF